MHKKLVERKAGRQQLLMPAQNRLTRQQGAEPEHSGRYRDLIGSGLFHCACCGNVLVSSHAKIVATYEWPEFLDPKANEHIRTANDILYRTVRNDVLCSNCNARLGYVCNDGRLPAGVNYFINSVVLTFDESGSRNAETALASNERIAS